MAVLGNRLLEPRQDQFIFAELAEGVAKGPGLSLDPARFEAKSHAWRDSILNEWVREPAWAFGLVQVGARTSAYEPLYAYTLGAVFKSLQNPWLAARLINFFWGLAAAAGAYIVGFALAGRASAFWAGLGVALYPWYIYYGFLAMGEAAHVGLLAITLATFYCLSERGTGAAIAMGLSAAAFFLTRSIAFPLVVGLLCFFPIIARCPRKLLAICAVGVIFITAVAPWVIRNYNVHGEFVLAPTRGGVNLWMRNNPRVLSLEPGELSQSWEAIWPGLRRQDLLAYPELTGKGEVARDRELQRRMTIFLAANPSYFADMCGRRFVNLVKPYGPNTRDLPLKLVATLSYFYALVFGVWGIIAAARKGYLLKALPLALVFLFYLAYHSLIHGGVRYRLPADICLLILAGVGVAAAFAPRGRPATSR